MGDYTKFGKMVAHALVDAGDTVTEAGMKTGFSMSNLSMTMRNEDRSVPAHMPLRIAYEYDLTEYETIELQLAAWAQTEEIRFSQAQLPSAQLRQVAVWLYQSLRDKK